MTSALHRFPIYIPSKSRWDSRLTMRTLDRLGAEYRVIVEQQQFDDYARVIPERRLLVLDSAYQEAFDPFDGRGRSVPLGSGPARNMAWAHSMQLGYDWHWIVDDNIHGFFWRINNHKIPAADSGVFGAMEDFATRYRNVAMAGPNYLFFAKCRQPLPPFVTGTRIYSCNLIRNAVPLRWRGRYNEDVDLSLRMLKAGWNTLQFNAFLQNKAETQTVPGGNTDMYQAEGTGPKSQMLRDMHPDCVRLVHKFGRDHHHVDYRPWRGRALLVDPAAPAVRDWAPTLVAARKGVPAN